MDDRVHILGIRHHGPGSAASVQRALDTIAPRQVLIEVRRSSDGVVTLSGTCDLGEPQ